VNFTFLHRYESDGDYVGKAVELFGKYDADSSGGIELEEFAEMWAHAQLGPYVAQLTLKEDAAVKSSFRRFDTNRDNQLDKEELINMLHAVGYDVDAGYVQKAMEIFGSYDNDGSGGIDESEFRELWNHMNLAPKMEAAGFTEFSEAADAMGIAAPLVDEMQELSRPEILEVLVEYYTKYDPEQNEITIAAYLDGQSRFAEGGIEESFRKLCLQLKQSYGEHPLVHWHTMQIHRQTQYIKDPTVQLHAQRMHAQLQRTAVEARKAEKILKEPGFALPDTAPRYLDGSMTRVQRQSHLVELTFTDTEVPIGIRFHFKRAAKGKILLVVWKVMPNSLAARVPNDVQPGMVVDQIAGTPARRLLANKSVIESMLRRRCACTTLSCCVADVWRVSKSLYGCTGRSP
jgi:Ca2+-binding EF-hand superfamily protein